MTLSLLDDEPRNISMDLGIREKGEEGRWWRKEEEQGRERGAEMQELCSAGTGLQRGRTKMFWRWVVVTVTQWFKSTKYHLTLEIVHLQMVKGIDFMSHVFFHKKQKTQEKMESTKM